MGMDLKSVVLTIVSVSIGVVLVAQLLIPVANKAIEAIPADQSGWASLLGVVVTMSIIALVLVAVTGFTSKGRD